jgi:hypothetical protein
MKRVSLVTSHTSTRTARLSTICKLKTIKTKPKEKKREEATSPLLFLKN